MVSPSTTNGAISVMMDSCGVSAMDQSRPWVLQGRRDCICSQDACQSPCIQDSQSIQPPVRPGNGVKPKASNLSRSRPDVLPACTHYRCQFQRRNGDHAFPCRSQCGKAVISAANDAGNHRAQLKQLIDFRQRKLFHYGAGPALSRNRHYSSSAAQQPHGLVSGDTWTWVDSLKGWPVSVFSSTSIR